MSKLDKVLETLKAGQENQVDIVINTAELEYNPGSLIYLDMIMLLGSVAAQKELCNRIGLPYSYYSLLMDDAVEHNDALKYNVSYWMDFSKKPVLIRCLKKKFSDFEAVLSFRGVLLKRYHIINHYDAAKELVDQIKRKVCKEVELSRYIQEDDNQRFVFEVIVPGLKSDISAITGIDEDFAFMGVTLTNSELGRAVFELQPFIKFSSGLVLMLNYKETRMHLGSDLEPGIYDGGIDAVDFTLATVSDLISEVLTRLNKETLLQTVEEFYNEFKDKKPANFTDAIEVYLKGVGTNEDEGVHALHTFLNSTDKSALTAYKAVVNAILEQGKLTDYYEKLDKARNLAISFGEKKRARK